MAEDVLNKMRVKLAMEVAAAYPHVRKDDIPLMHRYLNPQPGEYIIGIRQCNGFFGQAMAQAIGCQVKFIVAHLSACLLEGLNLGIICHKLKF